MVDHVEFPFADYERFESFYSQALAPLDDAPIAEIERKVETGFRAAGGRDNEPPGLRPHYHPGYCAVFVLDPDGHNIEAVCHGPE